MGEKNDLGTLSGNKWATSGWHKAVTFTGIDLDTFLSLIDTRS